MTARRLARVAAVAKLAASAAAADPRYAARDGGPDHAAMVSRSTASPAEGLAFVRPVLAGVLRRAGSKGGDKARTGLSAAQRDALCAAGFSSARYIDFGKAATYGETRCASGALPYAPGKSTRPAEVMREIHAIARDPSRGPMIVHCMWGVNSSGAIAAMALVQFCGWPQDRARPEGKDAKDQASGELAKFKPTMNARGTSGPYSASPLLYYHLSRYLEADVGVPPAVWRSMDRGAHLSEVARPGLAQSGTSHSSEMNHAGWRVLVEADADPSTYAPTSDLFTSDGSALYGVLLRSPGSRYNAAVNGTRKSGWGKGQNLDFQETAPFLALRSGKPLAEAVAEAVTQARRDPQMARDLPADTDPRQIVFWMRDVAGIALLDFIFSQQDRIGNIDYTAYWLWAEDGALKRRKAKHHGPEEDAAPAGAIRILRANLNDNDAGARVEYANFAKSTGMLEAMRRFPAATYARLMALDADFRAQGPLYAYVRDSFGLDARQVAQIVANTGLAAGILGDACRRGDMAFDVEPEAFFLSGTVAPKAMGCDGA